MGGKLCLEAKFMVQLVLLYNAAWLQPPFPAGALVSLMLPAAAHGPRLTTLASSPTVGWEAPLACCCQDTAGLSSPCSQGHHWEACIQLRCESC